MPDLFGDDSQDYGLLRHSPGPFPNSLLNARLNAASDSYPTAYPTCATASLDSRSLCAANCILQYVRYCIGAFPTNVANLSANPDRLIPTSAASASALQSFAGCACINATARPICASRNPANHPLRSSGSPSM